MRESDFSELKDQEFSSRDYYTILKKCYIIHTLSHQAIGFTKRITLSQTGGQRVVNQVNFSLAGIIDCPFLSNT